MFDCIEFSTFLHGHNHTWIESFEMCSGRLISHCIYSSSDGSKRDKTSGLGDLGVPLSPSRMLGLR